MKKTLLFILLMALFAPFAMNAQETLTVYDEAGTNTYVPIYGLYCDDGVKCEFIVPAGLLEDMTNGTISDMTFYLKSVGQTTITPTFTVFVKEVESTTLTGFTGTTGSTTVFHDAITFTGNTTDVEIAIPFSSDYSYGGGNLLIGIYQDEGLGTGHYTATTWYGEIQNSNTAWSGSGNGSGRSFLPKTTFTYEPAPQSDCETPATLVADEVLAHEATLTWTGGSGTYNVLYKTSAQSWDEATTAYSALSDYTCTLSGLAANTAYQARVMSVCGEETSNPKAVSFTTPIACPVPTDFAVAIVPGEGNKAIFSWTAGGEETAWQLCIDGNENNLITMTENPFTYDQFTAEQTYTAKMRAYCDNIDQSTWSNTVTFTPTNAYMITVNDGTNTNGYIPVYGYYVDASIVSQWIIPATALSDMQWGTINSMTFYASQTSINWGNAMFEVYMAEVENTTLSSMVDWTTMTKVMNAGNLGVSGNQMVITLDAPYQYFGGNLLIGIKQTASGSYVSSTWYGVTATGASLGGNGTGSQQNFLPKTTFAYIPGEEPSCYMPTGLAVNYTGGTTATVSWTSDASAWNMTLNGTPVEGTITNPYTLEGLELGTTYEIQVQAVCDGSVSDWNAVSFTTDYCLANDMCTISYELADNYGDGWNGNYLQVLDVDHNTVLATWTISSGSSASGSLSVCDGTMLQITYVLGSSSSNTYPGENSFVITDINNETIWEVNPCSASTANEVVTYTMNCTPATCAKPTDLTVVPGGLDAVISWTAGGEETAWQICVNDDENSLIEVTENPYTLEGLTLSTDYTVRVRAYCGEEDGYSNWTSNVSFTTLECEESCSITYVLTANEYQGSYSYGWYYSGIKVFDANTQEQIGFLTVPYGSSVGTVTGELSLCDGKEIYFQWYSDYSATNDNVLVGGYAIYDNKGDVIAEANGPMSADVNYTMDCSMPDCMWPTNLAVEPSYTSAEISWEGNARSYNVQYRTSSISFYEGFEYGLDNQGWTTIANGEVPSSGDFTNGWATYEGGHSGSKAAASRSWASDVALSADNYLITPQLVIQPTLKFWVKCSYPSAADEYEVLLSTNGTDIRDFTVTLKEMTAATGDWQEIVIDEALSRYVGQRGYIAIHHVYEDGELLLVDDFMLMGSEEDAGRWQEATTNEASIELTNLEMDTWYEYQVQSVCDDGESEWRGGTFQTLNGNIKTFNNDGYWNVDANWFPAGVPTANQTAVINAKAIIPAGYIAAASVTLGQNGSIVIEDGGQFQNMGDDVTVTIEKNITGYGDGNGNWYLISSSVFNDLDEDAVAGANLINSVAEEYDFYEFDGTNEGAEWVNKKDDQNFNMLRGIGYLYANKEDVTLSFTGTATMYATGAYWYATASYLNYNTEKAWGTMNLVGNCLTYDAVLYLYANNVEQITDFYRINGGYITLSDNAVLAPNEAVVIEATSSSQRLVAGAPESAKSGSMLNIAVLSDNEKVDMARVRFDGSHNLTKFQLNQNQTKVYFPQDDKDFAVVNAGNEGEMPLNFKAEKNGTYTLSFSSENTEFSYLHLIDNMTGNDVDLLATSNYTFEAQSTDYTSRFKLVFAQGSNMGDNFAFISDGEIILNGQGTVQVYDVTGRMISSHNDVTSISTSGMANGVYMLRLINGENVKTQKIVVR